MNTADAIGCEQFDAHVDELVLGQVDEPLRSRLLAHSDGCTPCHSSLEGLGSVVDRLLLAAPEVEPSAGFENRVLARLDAESIPTGSSGRRRWPIVTAAAAAGVLLLAAGLLMAVPSAESPVSAHAPIVAPAGREIGSADLMTDPTPHILVTIDAYRSGPGRRTCELQRPDGTWERVGSWDADDVSAGVWAAGIDSTLLDARAMRVVTADGDIVATATFD